MRVTQVLLATSAALLANSGNFVAAGATKNETPAATTATPDITNDIFVTSMPFKCGNVSGTMVVTIDKSTLTQVSNSDSTGSKTVDFKQLDKEDAASGDEERFLFFGLSEYVNYQVGKKVWSWAKENL